MPVIPPPEPPVQIATGGDPDSVTNATLQLRSEYGDLWTRIRQGFVLKDLDTPLVKTAEDWYAARPDYVARMVERSRRYLYHIVVEVEKRGMPLEIALLPMIESAYNPMAYSRSRASGIWQFIPSTGRPIASNRTGGSTSAATSSPPPARRSITCNTSTKCRATGISRWPRTTGARMP